MSGITVGIDGSDHSIYALDWALREAAARHTSVTVLAVDSVPISPWTGQPVVDRTRAILDDVRQAAEEITAKATSQLGDAKPTSVSVRAVSGFPTTELIDASRDADLVVVGSRGAGGFAQTHAGLGQQPG